MQRPKNLKVGDRFRVIEGDNDFNVGDGSARYFWNAGKTSFTYINFSKIEPYTKSVSDVQARRRYFTQS